MPMYIYTTFWQIGLIGDGLAFFIRFPFSWLYIRLQFLSRDMEAIAESPCLKFESSDGFDCVTLAVTLVFVECGNVENLVSGDLVVFHGGDCAILAGIDFLK